MFNSLVKQVLMWLLSYFVCRNINNLQFKAVLTRLRIGHFNKYEFCYHVHLNNNTNGGYKTNYDIYLNTVLASCYCVIHEIQCHILYYSLKIQPLSSISYLLQNKSLFIQWVILILLFHHKKIFSGVWILYVLSCILNHLSESISVR